MILTFSGLRIRKSRIQLHKDVEAPSGASVDTSFCRTMVLNAASCRSPCSAGVRDPGGSQPHWCQLWTGSACMQTGGSPPPRWWSASGASSLRVSAVGLMVSSVAPCVPLPAPDVRPHALWVVCVESGS